MLIYFDHTFCGTQGSNENLKFDPYMKNAANFPIGPTNPTGISNYAQVKATNLLIKNLARIINSPFALGFASVTPAGYLFPIPNGNISMTGIDICVKWYQGGAFSNSSGTFNNGFYIFAQPRASENASNISATFIVKSGTSVAVIGENRSIPIIGGQFTDIFARGLTVHIYQII